jgi:hypothetical protein
MRAIKLQGQVMSDHSLHLQLPKDVGEGPAEVIVLVPEAGKASAGSLAEALGEASIDERFIRSKEAIDRDLVAERKSWE